MVAALAGTIKVACGWPSSPIPHSESRENADALAELRGHNSEVHRDVHGADPIRDADRNHEPYPCGGDVGTDSELGPAASAAADQPTETRHHHALIEAAEQDHVFGDGSETAVPGQELSILGARTVFLY